MSKPAPYVSPSSVYPTERPFAASPNSAPASASATIGGHEVILGAASQDPQLPLATIADVFGLVPDASDTPPASDGAVTDSALGTIQ